MKDARQGLEWSHEDASQDMLQFLVVDNEVDIDASEVCLVCKCYVMVYRYCIRLNFRILGLFQRCRVS